MFYVITAGINRDSDKPELLIRFHGGFEDGYLMEEAIINHKLGISQVLERIRVENGEIFKLDGPFQPKDEIL